MLHWDSGSVCSAPQSPLALKAGITSLWQRVQIASGTPCPPQKPFVSRSEGVQNGQSAAASVWGQADVAAPA